MTFFLILQAIFLAFAQEARKKTLTRSGEIDVLSYKKS